MSCSSLLTNDAKRVYKQFADDMYSKYMNTKYGMKTCSSLQDMTKAIIRKEILEYQLHADADALTYVSHNFSLYDPIYYKETKKTVVPSCDLNVPVHYIPTCGSVSQSCLNSHLNVDTGNGNSNIVEINSGGCITRINLNNTVNIRNPNYTWIQETPSDTWDIQHVMGFNPNVRIEDVLGNDISGTIDYINTDRLKIYFSSAVAGTAYLS